MRNHVLAAVAAVGLLLAPRAFAQLPSPAAETILRQGGIPITRELIQQDAAQLVGALSVGQRTRLGSVDIRLEGLTTAGSCNRSLRLAQSSHEDGRTTITICERALIVYIDNATVQAIFPFLGTLSAESLYNQSAQTTNYTLLLLKAAFQQHQGELRYCSPYLYLASIAASPDHQANCGMRLDAPERSVIAALDRSALLSSMVGVNARMKFVSADIRPAQYMALNLVLLIKGSIDFLLAHEIGHHVCVSSCSEDEIDSFAMDLVARSPSTVGYMANFQSAQSIIFFSSLFSDDAALLFQAPMDQATLRREVIKRQVAAACAGTKQLKLLEEGNHAALKAFGQEARKEGGVIEAMADLSLLKMMLAIQCSGMR